MRTAVLAIGVLLAAGVFLLASGTGSSDADPSVLDSGSCGDDLTWTIFDNGHLVIEGSGDMKNFANNEVRWGGFTVRSATLPDGLTSIGDRAFRYCMALKEVSIPDGVTRIGESAFGDCASLTAINLPDSLTSMGMFAFNGCYSLRTLEIPASLNMLESTALLYCDGLRDITLRCNSVNYSTFSTLPLLETVTVGEEVAELKDPMEGSTGLVRVDVEEGNANYCSVDGVLFSKDMKTLIRYPPARAGSSYTVPDGVTHIDRRAFWYSANLKEIIFPDSLGNIGDFAFKGCTSLESVDPPEGTYTGMGVFSGCSSLKTYHLGEDTHYYQQDLDGCTALTSITVDPDNYAYTSVDGILFSKDLKTLYRYPAGRSAASYTIPDSVTKVWDYAFADCDLTSVVIPDSVTAIGSCSFYGCTSLVTVAIPDSVTALDTYAFCGCTSLTSFTLGSGVNDIPSGLVQDCSSLKTFHFTANIADISPLDTRGCSSMETVTVDPANPNYCSLDGVVFTKDLKRLIIYPEGKKDSGYDVPDSVTSIASAFGSNPYLRTVDIPSSVTNIGDYTLEACSALQAINVDADNPNYRSADGVLFSKDLTRLVCYPSGRTAGTFELPAEVTDFHVPSYGSGHHLRSITVAEGNTVYRSDGTALYADGGKTLVFCPSAVTSFTIPADVTFIDMHAFSNGDLRDLTFPSGCTVYLKLEAVCDCIHLRTLTVEEGAALGLYNHALENETGTECDVLVHLPKDLMFPSYAHPGYTFVYADDPPAETPVLVWVAVAIVVAAVLGAAAYFMIVRKGSA